MGQAGGHWVWGCPKCRRDVRRYLPRVLLCNLNGDTDYGLAGYVQGEVSHAQEVARHIRAGQITINGGNRENAAPFGGYKASGNGREHGLHGLEDYLETKALISPLG